MTQDPRDTAGGRRVLIVDDDRVILKMFTDFFDSELPGYRVTTARTGAAGLEAFLAESPHVVLVDFNMPGMDGLSVLKAVRGIDRDVPIIMVTGATGSEPAEALRNGAFAYIPKPFDFRYVRVLVELAAQHAERTRAARSARSNRAAAVS